jgi:hypothetical protein
MLRLYGITDEPEIEGWITASKEARTQGWWIAYDDALPREYRDFIALEAAAKNIRVFQGMLMPGLVQTEDYARAVVAAGPAVLPMGHVDSLIKVRMSRQEILEQDRPPKFWIILAEGTVRQEVGGPAKMAEQLAHLMHLTDLSSVTLQLLPFSAGAHAGVQSAFTLFDFPDGEASVASVENLTGNLLMDKPGQVESFSQAFDSLRASALSPAESLTRIEQIREELLTKERRKNA